MEGDLREVESSCVDVGPGDVNDTSAGDWRLRTLDLGNWELKEYHKGIFEIKYWLLVMELDRLNAMV